MKSYHHHNYTLLTILFFLILQIPKECLLHSKSLSVSLTANWQGSPLAAEAAEFLYQQDPLLFWNYIENFGSSASNTTSAAAQQKSQFIQ